MKDPVYTITIEFSGGKERMINIGVVTPSENGYYVQDVSSKEVVIVSKSAVDALLGIVGDSSLFGDAALQVPSLRRKLRFLLQRL